jgi:hypothetical protein
MIELKQTIYPHGGSRIWLDIDGERKLLVDTFTTKEFAEAARKFVEEWLIKEGIIPKERQWK